MKKNQCHYFAVKIQQLSLGLEFDNLTEMCRFIDVNQITNVFIAYHEILAEYFFAIYHNAGLLIHKTNGYKTLENYLTAQEKGFPDAIIFYEALAAGYQNYHDYQLMKEAGISDLITLETMKKRGFINGYNTYKELKEKEPNFVLLDTVINNPYELYSYAKKHNFEECSKLLEAFSRGFADADLYSAAKELGFPTYNDFTDASKRGFRFYSDLRKANELGIKDSSDFGNFINLELGKKGDQTHDQIVLITILSKIEQGKKISLNKLNSILEKSIEEYKFESSNELPKWFTISFKGQNDIATFLDKDNEVKQYGTYDADGEFFEIIQMQKRAVVLDASNVAHNSGGRTDKKVYASNLILMIDFLKSKGFTDISIIADASLRHKLEDADKMEKVKQMAQYLESPKETTADLFLIQYVKRNHCLVVSNDTFREWKVQDSWVAGNIDFYRLSFIIKGQEVLMPDLK